MDLLEEIRKSVKKPKELNEYIAELILKEKPSSKEYEEAITSGTDAERGTCVEALEYVTQTNPEIAKPYLPEVIKCLWDKAPRVKWEAARVIGNVAKSLPTETERAVDGLLQNTTDKSTVVRWSTAFALGEFLKANVGLVPGLLEKVEDISAHEENHGVKNVYLKALKVVNR